MSIALFVLSLVAQTNPRQVDHSRFGAYFMNFSTVWQGVYGGSAPKDIIVMRNSVQWDKLRSQIGLTDDENKKMYELHGSLGAMDWTTEQLVFLRSGTERTGGYSAKAQKVLYFRTTQSWKVTLLVTPPPKDALTTDALTNPFVVIRTRRTQSDPTVEIVRAKPK
ncbi:MAG: protease complex subunit PrcB family protein [Chthonomonadaceae bacterium]|nr:protease complex subunit PrcB family protein [Chthonomonadaceae bacterium]